MNLIHDSIIPYPFHKSVIARVCWVHTTEILPASSHCLLDTISFLTDEWGCFSLSINWLEDVTGLDRKTVVSALKRLVAYGWLGKHGPLRPGKSSIYRPKWPGEVLPGTWWEEHAKRN